MNTPQVFPMEGPDGKYVEILFEGKVYKFHHRSEDGAVWCYWWEGQFDKYAVRHLLPFAVETLGGHAPQKTPSVSMAQAEADTPVVREHRLRFTPSGFSCIHCGTQSTGQAPDKCPNCEQDPAH